MPFVSAWMGPEGIALSEVSQTEREMPNDFTYRWNLKNKTKQKQTRRYREQTDDFQEEGAGWIRLRGTEVQTSSYKIKIPWGRNVQHKE